MLGYELSSLVSRTVELGFILMRRSVVLASMIAHGYGGVPM